jgi:hypothetical protein
MSAHGGFRVGRTFVGVVTGPGCRVIPLYGKRHGNRRSGFGSRRVKATTTIHHSSNVRVRVVVVVEDWIGTDQVFRKSRRPCENALRGIASSVQGFRPLDERLSGPISQVLWNRVGR